MKEAVIEQRKHPGGSGPDVSASATPNRPQTAVRSFGSKRQAVLLPVGFGVLFLLLWQGLAFHRLFRLELYQLPIPSAILQAMASSFDVLSLYAAYTGLEAIGGFAIGSCLGFGAAALASFVPKVGRGGIAILASLNAVPIVALAPIMNNWFGDGVSSRIGVVSVLTMATMAVSAYKGLRSVEPNCVELMEAYAAGSWHTFIMLRCRNALPSVFSALKINMSTSMIGAIVGEFFISSRGLGYLLSDQIRLANMPLAWSCIVIAAILGIALYAAVASVERMCMPWHISRRG